MSELKLSKASETVVRELLDTIIDGMTKLRAHIPYLESEVARAQAAPQWEANHQRIKLEELGLADEFPYDCDSIEHVGEALLAERAKVAKLESVLQQLEL